MSTYKAIFFFCVLFVQSLSLEASTGLISYDDLESKPVWKIEKLQSNGIKIVTRADQQPFLTATKSSKILNRNYLHYNLVVGDDTSFNGYDLKKGSIIGLVHFLGTKKVNDLPEEFGVPCPEFCTKITFLDVLRQAAATLSIADVGSLDFTHVKDAISKKS